MDMRLFSCIIEYTFCCTFGVTRSGCPMQVGAYVIISRSQVCHGCAVAILCRWQRQILCLGCLCRLRSALHSDASVRSDWRLRPDPMPAVCLLLSAGWQSYRAPCRLPLAACALQRCTVWQTYYHHCDQRLSHQHIASTSGKCRFEHACQIIIAWSIMRANTRNAGYPCLQGCSPPALFYRLAACNHCLYFELIRWHPDAAGASCRYTS